MCGEIKIRNKKGRKILNSPLSTCKVYNLFHYHIACIQEFLTNGCYMFLVSGFHNDTKGTSGDICTLTISLMMYRNYISSLLCDNFADSQQLPRFVYQVQSYCIGTSRLCHTATDDTAQYRHINITSRHQANSFLTLYRYLIEHGCSNGHSSRPLCNNPLAFYQCQNSCGNLALGQFGNRNTGPFEIIRAISSSVTVTIPSTY